MSGRRIAAILALSLTAGTGSAGSRSSVEPTGYLTDAGLSVLADAAPLPPVAGSAAFEADIAASRRLRALENGDRWLLATRHAELRPSLAMAHFDCALGFRVVMADSPRLAALLARVARDAEAAAERAKARVHRPRPVAADPDRPACQVLTPPQRASPSYPSGSAAVGAAYGATVAALVPDRADAVLEIGRQIGVSRMVCGMHYPSDVAAGQALGQATYDALSRTGTFVADLAAARIEVEAARARAAASPACAAERAALAVPMP